VSSFGEASSLYESPKLLGEYMLLHYGGEAEMSHAGFTLDPVFSAIPFPVRCVRELIDLSRLPSHAEALEIGCSVGASAFELARYCSRVVASDYSESFITAAQTLQREGRFASARTLEGEIAASFMAHIPAEICRDRVSFSVADATQLPANLENFDVVLAANLICRLSDPRSFLARTSTLLKPGGQLLLTTPFTWLEEYTPLKSWIGGVDPQMRSETELNHLLKDDFQLHRRCDLPFLIREHERKYQLGIALGTCWIRR
jgi:putative 4-mercaptohistidine N1-methyltranferase